MHFDLNETTPKSPLNLNLDSNSRSAVEWKRMIRDLDQMGVLPLGFSSIQPAKKTAAQSYDALASFMIQ